MSNHHHNRLHRRQDDSTVTGAINEARTVTHVVYTTLPQTFEGEPAGYWTIGASDGQPTQTVADIADVEATAEAMTAPAAGSQQTQPSQVEPTQMAAAQETNAQGPEPTANAQQNNNNNGGEAVPSSIVDPNTKNLDNHTTLVQASETTASSSKTSATRTSSTSSATMTSATPSSSPSSSAGASSEGLTSAAKAGIAFGVLGGALILGLLLWLILSKRKKNREQQQGADDEKASVNMGPFADPPPPTTSHSTTPSSATAPQLSLRPVTEFFPNFGERRSSKGAAIALATTNSKPQPRAPGDSLWERPGTSHSNHHENPFGNNAERSNITQPQTQTSNPFDAPEHVVGMASTTDEPTIGMAVSDESLSAMAVSSKRKSSTPKANEPEPLDLTLARSASPGPTPPSPAGTEYSMQSMAPGQSPGPSKSAAVIAEAGGPASTTVHRVQLEFLPTLDDEMEIRAGQLVRLLYEYDDGWCLCIRLDRSKQGVVPRTCISTRPVKPRPAAGPGARNGPPVNPNGPRGPPRGPMPGPGGRPMTPQGGPGFRPDSPAGMRPHSPAQGRPMSPYGSRPHSPATGRGPMGPGQGPRQQRPQSPNGMSRGHGPPGPSPMNPYGSGRPGPGQAY